jgi:hypothetical protein
LEVVSRSLEARLGSGVVQKIRWDRVKEREEG